MKPVVKELNLYRTSTIAEVIPDEHSAAFGLRAPHGSWSRDVARCIVIDGRAYPLAPDCPEEGLGTWTPTVQDARDAEEDAALVSLPEALRKRLAPGWRPSAERVAERVAEAARVASERDARGGAAGIVEPEPDEQ